jgi:tetratricopeptide (TPR) repeat protein
VRHLLPPSLPSIPPTTHPSLATHAQVNSYTDAIKLDTKNHVLYSNRANAYTRLESFKEALRDADECVKLEGDWAKGHARRGAALAGLLQHDEAREAYSRAVRRRLFRLGSAPGGEGWVGRVGGGGGGGAPGGGGGVGRAGGGRERGRTGGARRAASAAFESAPRQAELDVGDKSGFAALADEQRKLGSAPASKQSKGVGGSTQGQEGSKKVGLTKREKAEKLRVEAEGLKASAALTPSLHAPLPAFLACAHPRLRAPSCAHTLTPCARVPITRLPPGLATFRSARRRPAWRARRSGTPRRKLARSSRRRRA